MTAEERHTFDPIVGGRVYETSRNGTQRQRATEVILTFSASSPISTILASFVLAAT